MSRRRDKKNRILRPGEACRDDGRYQYRWTEDGVRHVVYSWKLEETDPLPKDKKECKALRTIESEIQMRTLKGIVTKDITVYEALDMHLTRKSMIVKANTRANYVTILKNVKNERFSNRKVREVKTSEAKNFLLHLKKNGASYSKIVHIKCALKQAFENCVEDDIIVKNPFSFALSSIMYNDSEKKEALSKKDEKRILNFIKDEEYGYEEYYPAIKVLFLTGMRISEFCGLTDKDIDFKNHTITINKQLIYRKAEGGAFIQFSTKTESGTRVIPVSNEVLDCFRQMIKQRPEYAPFIDRSGVRGFFYFTRDKNPMTGSNWGHVIHRIRDKFNSVYRKEIPYFSAHTARHTFASRCATANINPVYTAAYLGHSNAETTLSIYTHISADDLRIDFFTKDQRSII